MQNKTKQMKCLEKVVGVGFWIEILIGVVSFYLFMVLEINLFKFKPDLLGGVIQSMMVWFLARLTIGFIEYVISIYDKLDKLKKIEKYISRDVISLQYGTIDRLNSSIIVELLQRNEPLSNFLINELKFKPTNTLTQKILDEFKSAKSKNIAKACCVINDRKFIEIKKDELSQSLEMLNYFIQHKNVTDENLIISRIFSFPYENFDNKIKISVLEDDHRYILYLYLIANFYSGVHTHLHLYNCDIANSCEFNDYVSLMVYDHEASYQTFIAPANHDTDSLLTIKDDLMLAQALEKDFKRKLDKETSTNLTGLYTNFKEGFIKIKPENFKAIHSHLGLEGTKTKIRNTLLSIINTLDDEIKKEYKKAINQFLLK